MKKIFIALFVCSVALVGCGGSEFKSEDYDFGFENDEFSIEEEETSKEDIQEIVCERYRNGDKKTVCFYRGYGSNEQIVKKFIIMNREKEAENLRKNFMVTMDCHLDMDRKVS